MVASGGRLDKIVYIERLKNESSVEWGTFGRLNISGTDFSCYTLERPWNNNRPDDPKTPQNESSCVPTGTYIIRLDYSPKHKRELYELQNVSGRHEVQIHAANWIHELLGCIALGRAIEDFGGGKGVTHSAKTLESFMQAMEGDREATLIIHGWQS